jgi:formylglycine-generating enzyme required for sulfatase activity
VTIGHGFYLATLPVTQAQWRVVMPVNPSRFPVDERPVEQVSWQLCQEFVVRLGQRIGDWCACRLPTEAEWEYACRAGTATDYWNGSAEKHLDLVGWYAENSGKRTHKAGGKKANPWGLFDMHGNVWEWCQDWHAAYDPDDVTDPVGPPTGRDKVIRGGGWLSPAAECRAAARNWFLPDYRSHAIGFRVLLQLL